MGTGMNSDFLQLLFFHGAEKYFGPLAQSFLYIPKRYFGLAITEFHDSGENRNMQVEDIILVHGLVLTPCKVAVHLPGSKWIKFA
jgi:hypothetical protein